MDEEHAEYNILLTVQRHTFDDFYRKTGLSPLPKVVLLLWFVLIHIVLMWFVLIPNTSYMLHGSVATRILFGNSLSPLLFSFYDPASTVTTLPSMAAHPAFRNTC